jgi:hypothetical protein
MASLILPSANTAMMNLFLEHVSRTFADYFLVMQVDRAGWHRAKDLVVPANMRLIFQPACSPEPESSWSMCGRICARSIYPIALFSPLMK